MAHPLPPGWEERMHNGRPYYLNHNTQTTTVRELAVLWRLSTAFLRSLRAR